MTALLLIILMLYYLSIAGISICCDIPFPIKITEESAPFIQDLKAENVDLTFCFKRVNALSVPPEDAVWESGNYYHTSKDAACVYYCDYPNRPPYARVRVNFPISGLMICEYVSGAESRFSLSRNIINFLGLESLLLRNQSLLLHSSFIRVKGYGILFTAPSGTGKSTQADLWAKYESADILNGDRAALRCDHGVWTAWGLPYAGTSGIYRNESAPVRAIVVLRQSELNTIRRLGPAEALRFIYPELTIHRWDASSVDTAVNLLTELVTNVPVYLLECRPDEEAVLTLKNVLNESKEAIS